MARFLKKLLTNKTDEEGDSFTSAHLGEENNFYYNEELRQWVVRGEEERVRETLNSTPPPVVGTEPNCDPSVPPTSQTNANGLDGTQVPVRQTHLVSHPTSTHLSRRVVRSSQLYTNIPGMNVVETRPASGPFLNMPQSPQSQFVPSKEDFDPSLVNDAYADLMKRSTSTSTSTSRNHKPEDEQKQ
ncbi:hypothetical protein TpMuguga_03g00509 [Theileria parva strain Muguga]|uniref:uncharacterized protein n=1 Tax=Theileria parva strain Muguga TaxID=333668 RepID=UPI001C621FEA|nr:uncharacterized protein TpMuguga_03g00509 [Theileria parva strain Muguga]KAF5153145.1 hypothetical protein TpMuguga_03g00509 [Theileria parva strain Muguga]